MARIDGCLRGQQLKWYPTQVARARTEKSAVRSLKSREVSREQSRLERVEVEEFFHHGVELPALRRISHLDAVVVDDVLGLLDPFVPAGSADPLLHFLPAGADQRRRR